MCIRDSKKGAVRKRGPLFLLSAHSAVGMAAPVALHGIRGIFSHVREYPPWTPQENARGSAPRPRHCERASRRTAVLAESDACLVLYLNDLTLFYLRCRFACVSTVFSNLRLLRIFIVLLLPAKAALLRSPRRGAPFLVLCCDIDFFCFLLGRDKYFFGVAVILCFDLGKCVGDCVE